MIFLAEAFTRPKLMKGLAKLGFTQSYTYFTWRTQHWELEQYLNELTGYPERDYYRPNFFVNTPDILPYHLQSGETWMFKSRVALAATLSGTYGIYNGFELLEHEPIPGREEYLNSEKYEIKVRDWDKPGNIKPYITRSQPRPPRQPGAAADQQSALPPIEDGNVIGFVKESVDQTNTVVGGDRAVARRARILVAARRRPGRHGRRRPPQRRRGGKPHHRRTLSGRMGRHPRADRSGARSRAALPLPGVRGAP